jgi:hypothetical protein
MGTPSAPCDQSQNLNGSLQPRAANHNPSVKIFNTVRSNHNPSMMIFNPVQTNHNPSMGIFNPVRPMTKPQHTEKMSKAASDDGATEEASVLV